MWRVPISVGLWILREAQFGLGLRNWALVGVHNNWTIGLGCENQLGPSPISFLFSFSSFLPHTQGFIFRNPRSFSAFWTLGQPFDFFFISFPSNHVVVFFLLQPPFISSFFQFSISSLLQFFQSVSFSFFHHDSFFSSFFLCSGGELGRGRQRAAELLQVWRRHGGVMAGLFGGTAGQETL
jgi:hypothetical protein